MLSLFWIVIVVRISIMISQVIHVFSSDYRTSRFNYSGQNASSLHPSSDINSLLSSSFNNPCFKMRIFPFYYELCTATMFFIADRFLTVMEKNGVTYMNEWIYYCLSKEKYFVLQSCYLRKIVKNKNKKKKKKKKTHKFFFSSYKCKKTYQPK